MRDLPAWARAALLAGSASALFAAMASLGTADDPYAPNDWLFSHIRLAENALSEERLPLNRNLLTESSFSETVGEFRLQTGLDRMTFYATTTWHFWNGLPLHPSLLATLSATTGLEPETTARLPLGGVVVLLLVLASADLLLARTGVDGRLAVIAPFVALASTPLVLDLRVLMPSVTLVILAALQHLLLRRHLLGDETALPLALAPLALLPFWYYTVSYFVILLFAGFLGANVLLRMRGSPTRPLVPLAVAALVPIALSLVLVVNGALTSHFRMASSLGGIPWLGAEAGSDYESHLNRQPWRSGLLYLETALLFAPLAALSLRAGWAMLRRRSVEPAPAVFAQWSAGTVPFIGILYATVGVSFLNRGVIYLTPLAALAFAWGVGRAWGRPWARGLAAATVGLGLVATPALVATATPSYGHADRDAFEWMDEHVPKSAVVYSSLEVSSVLFRRYGFNDAIAFHPRMDLLQDFWYSEDPETTVVYLSSFDYFVLRDDVRTAGFEEFGPLRQPVSDKAYEKFERSRDLHLVFDNGETKVFQVALAPDRFQGPPRSADDPETGAGTGPAPE